MLRRQGPYLIVRKIFLFVYELDFPEDSRIYPMISIVYLLRYRVYNDLFKRIFAFPGFVEYSAETNTSGNDVRNGKHWELKCIIDYTTRRGKTHYLMHWKRYGPKYDKWLKLETFKYAIRLLEDYHKRLRHKDELRGAGDGI